MLHRLLPGVEHEGTKRQCTHCLRHIVFWETISIGRAECEHKTATEVFLGVITAAQLAIEVTECKRTIIAFSS